MIPCTENENAQHHSGFGASRVWWCRHKDPNNETMCTHTTTTTTETKRATYFNRSMEMKFFPSKDCTALAMLALLMPQRRRVVAAMFVAAHDVRTQSEELRRAEVNIMQDKRNDYDPYQDEIAPTLCTNVRMSRW